MKVAFFSNFLNHHQAPFCEEMIKILGSDFVFVSTQKMPDSFRLSGYPDYENETYNHLVYKSRYNEEQALHIANSFDVVIIGSAPEYYVRKRIRENKLTFRYSERWHKRLSIKLFSFKRLLSIFYNHTMHRQKKLYMLCASSFTKSDVYKYFAYPDKCFKWGYFTKVDYIPEYQLIRQNDKVKILWVGRFIDWKHPELAVLLAEKLKMDKIEFELIMVGTGELFGMISELVTTLNLTENVTLTNALPNDDILKLMRNSDIFIFTSDRNEGWGAVLSEAMSQGCASVVSNQIGSAFYLIENQVNGLLFESNNIESLYCNTMRLIKDKDLRNTLGLNAYRTMFDYWNPAKAAQNLIYLINTLIYNKKSALADKGPCSKA